MEKSWKIIEIEFESKPVYGDDDKYVKTKIKIYGASLNINFQDKKMPKEKAPCNCWSIIMQRKSITLKHSWKNANMNKKR